MFHFLKVRCHNITRKDNVWFLNIVTAFFFLHLKNLQMNEIVVKYKFHSDKQMTNEL